MQPLLRRKKCKPRPKNLCPAPQIAAQLTLGERGPESRRSQGSKWARSISGTLHAFVPKPHCKAGHFEGGNSKGKGQLLPGSCSLTCTCAQGGILKGWEVSHRYALLGIRSLERAVLTLEGLKQSRPAPRAQCSGCPGSWRAAEESSAELGPPTCPSSVTRRNRAIPEAGAG